MGLAKVTIPALFMVVIFSATSCSSSQSNKNLENPWKSTIDAQRESFTDYEWEILQDYQVTDAELRDAKDKTTECMSKSGLTYEYMWPYGARITEPSGMSRSEGDRIYDECSVGVSLRIEGFHAKMRKNPDNVEFDSLVVSCLIKKELVSESFTVQDLNNPDSSEYQASIVHIQDDPEWIRCVANPIDNPDLHEYVESLIPRTD